MTVFDFKVWPRLFTGEDAAFDYMKIESLTDYCREHGFLKDDEASAILLEWLDDEVDVRDNCKEMFLF